MNTSKLKIIVISILCLTLFTACGERSSKKRKATPVFAGHTDSTNKGGSTDPRSVMPEEDEQSEHNDDNFDVDQPLTDEELLGDDFVPVSNHEQTESNNTNGKREVFLVGDNQTSNHQDGSSSPEPITDNTQTTITDSLSGLNFYPNVSFNPELYVPNETHTNFATPEGFNYTDLVSDGVMYNLKNLFENDIDTQTANPDFRGQSLELSQAINNLNSIYNPEDKSLSVSLKLSIKNSGEQTLKFYGFVKNNKARLLPTNDSADFDYVLDVVCLDRSGSQCQTQQVILSLYYKKNVENTDITAGSLCKRAYMVNRISHATLNVDSTFLDHYANLESNGQLVRNKCQGANLEHVNNSILCTADFIYNTLAMARYKACTRKTNSDCLSQLNKPTRNYATSIHLYTFSVANGKSEFLLSIGDKEGKVLSFDGMLADARQDGLRPKLLLNKYSYNIDAAPQQPLVLSQHIQKGFLNGIDANSIMQLKIKYNLNTTKADNTIFADIIPRLPPVDTNNFVYHFEAPTNEERSDLDKQKEDASKENFSLMDSLKKLTKSKTQTFTSSKYSCKDLKDIVKKYKKVRIYQKGYGSVDIFSNKNSCSFGDNPTHANFLTSDRDSYSNPCQIEYKCEKTTSK